MTTPTNPVEIVDMTFSHAQHLAPLIARSDPWHRLGISAPAIQHLLERSAPHLLQHAILSRNQPVGAIVIQKEWLAGPYLQHLSILEEHRGGGFGTVALDWLTIQAQSNNQRSIWLCVSAFNTDAIRFYNRHGFKRAAVLDDLIVDDEDEILMRRQLP